MEEPRLALVVSQFNEEVTKGLLEGARAYLADEGVAVPPEDVFHAPGAFETPLLAQRLARTGRYDGVICLGCVIKGDTAHFEFISLGTAVGLMTASLATETPISFGILTTYDDAQAEARSRPGPENKGREAAAACLASIRALARIDRSV
jgi:6,7-dimethyl-8-ribityllumazine synthase